MGYLTVAETVVGDIDFTGLITALTGAITPAQLLAVLASVVGVGIGFVLMWFGARKAISAFTSAVMKGRLKL